MSPGVGVSGANVTVVVLEPGTELFEGVNGAACFAVAGVTPPPLPLPPPHAARAALRANPTLAMVPRRTIRSRFADDEKESFRVTRWRVRN
jgi:hypothetical protein